MEYKSSIAPNELYKKRGFFAMLFIPCYMQFLIISKQIDMKKTKILNLYAGIGGNRKNWDNVEVTAIE